ncbi:MAG: hypothetical protein ACRDFT_09590 [bacterium]
MNGSDTTRIINALIISHPAEPRLLVTDAPGGGQRLAVIQQVISYRHILDTVEPALRWEWHDAIPYFLRMLLREDPILKGEPS